MTNLGSELKSRDIALPIKVRIVKATIFPALLLLLSRFSRVRLCATPEMAAHQASPGKNTGVGCHFLLQYMKVKSESKVTQLCPTLSDPMDCSYQAPPSMGFSRQEYWSGVPLPSPNSVSTTYLLSTKDGLITPCSPGLYIL